MYIYLEKRIWFTIIFLPPKDVILSDLELSRIELPKLSVLMEINYSSFPGWSVIFLYAPAYKSLAFWKIIFEVVYIRIVLKSLLSY